MSDDRKSLILISQDPNVSTEIGAALRSLEDMTVKEHRGSLSEMNGTAVSLVQGHDIVLFRTGNPSGGDVHAIEALRRSLPSKTIIIALADADISLADARGLTRAGVHEVLPYPISADDVREHIARWSQPVPIQVSPDQRQDAVRQGKVIAVSQARGGVGSTTVAVNLADRLLDRAGMMKKRARNRVALIDLDLQFGAISSFLDIEAKDALYQLAMDGTKPDATFLQQSMIEMPSGLSVLTAPLRFAPMEALRPAQVAAMIDALRSEFDYIVIDLPRTLVDWLAPVLERVDRLMLVTDSAVHSVRQARRLIDFYTEDNIGLPIEIVINSEKKPLIMKRHHSEAAKVLERPLKHWIPYDPAAAREAMDRGVPLSVAASRSHIAKGINAVGRSIIAALSAKQQQISR